MQDTADARGLHDGPWQWSNSGVVVIGLFAVVIVGFLLMKIYTAIFVQFYADALLEREKQGSKDSELSNHICLCDRCPVNSRANVHVSDS